MGKNSFIIYDSLDAQTAELTDTQLGCLIRWVFRYRKTGEVPSIGEDPAVWAVFNLMRVYLDENEIRYAERCEVNKRNIEKRWQQASEKRDVYELYDSYNSNDFVRNVPLDTIYTNYTDKDKDKDNDNDDENEKENDKDSEYKEDTTQKIQGCTKEDRCREETPTLSPAPIPSQRPHWLPEPDYYPSEADMEARKLSMIELLRGKEANYRCNSL